MNKPPTGVLVIPGWERGVCPIHMFTRERCDMWCLPARRALLTLADDYAEFWSQQDQEHRALRQWAGVA